MFDSPPVEKIKVVCDRGDNRWTHTVTANKGQRPSDTVARLMADLRLKGYSEPDYALNAAGIPVWFRNKSAEGYMWDGEFSLYCRDDSHAATLAAAFCEMVLVRYPQFTGRWTTPVDRRVAISLDGDTGPRVEDILDFCKMFHIAIGGV